MQSNNKSIKTKKLFLGLGLLIIVCLGFFACKGAESEEDATYELTDIVSGAGSIRPDEEGALVKFYNKVDGYSIEIPRSMEADMSKSSVLATLENENLCIEIYNQPFSSKNKVTAKSYTDYSNLFLNNELDHKATLKEEKTLGDWNLNIAEWNRTPLKKIKNDKNYYASVDIILSEIECMTFLFKSNAPFAEINGEKSYMSAIYSFKLEKVSEKPYLKSLDKMYNSEWNFETRGLYDEFFGESAPLKWGIFEKEAPLSFRKLVDLEDDLDFSFPIVLYYTGFISDKDVHPKLAPALKNADAHNKLVELTLQTLPQDEGNGNMVYDVLNGKYDTFLMNYVKVIKDYGKPILFRLGNEMNGDWCSYSAYHTSKDTEVYKAFYRHVYHIFEKGGADNVIWVWNPNAKSYPNFKWNNELCYYPGDEYVDVIGLTNYNTGTYYEEESWVEFSKLYDEIYTYYQGITDKPLMITEFASSSIGGDKAEWVRAMFKHIKTYNELKVAVWWSSCDYDGSGNISRPYFMDETEGILKEFKEGLVEYK